MIIDSHHPGLAYANLAVRGRRIVDLLVGQLPHALAMRPDLITVCIGMNDVTRPGPFFDRALADLDTLHTRLARSGATVVTTTFPDLAQILPIGRVLVSRVEQINGEIRTAAERHGFRLVDLYDAPSMVDPEIWSRDRIHGSTKGHILFAGAAAEALGLPGSNHDWAQADGAVAPVAAVARTLTGAVDAEHAHAVAVASRPRRSEGDGRNPKRPRLAAVVSLEAQNRQRDRQ